ncbi:BatA domain-containing protein [Allorhodopirellula heiligendammensis]|uniref:Aerotolerance regulator N-terminal domain-containing protein n=1 Tax=Allorhodopirellula heiligendammensis TaxID=2714739 RepID=A0A5C6C0Q1_9BACT|nr:BatA domain-containing protein [Allorhodopirellula heiligendammensis]TWU18120.1 hypothetical protein Poly21_02750 [Allorhodopirellula heiligendammensis]
MSFINAAMALGAAAFVVPLAIHLLFRSRFRTLDWGAMFLLQDVVNANRRRMQWHQWILLALRCAIPILLALAMARPLLSSIGGRSLAGQAPVSLILMIDDSRSMSATSRSVRAVESANALLDSMSRRDEVILMSSSQLVSAPRRGSPRDAREMIRDLRFDGPPMSLSVALQAAVDACRDAAHPYRRIVLVSDFQENTFAGSSVDNHSLVLEVIDHLDERLAGFEPRPQVDFLDVTETDADSSTLANVLVESVSTDAAAILVGQSVLLTASIRNDSELPVTHLRAGWMVDGRVLHTQTVSIEPHGTTKLNWQTTFEKPGGASVGLSIEHADAIAADNRREWAIEVSSPVRVWLVDGQPSRQPLHSETDFLKVALSPFAFQSAVRRAGSSFREPSSSTRGPGSSTRGPRHLAIAQQDLVSTQVMSERTLVKTLEPMIAAESPIADETGEGFPDLIVLANVKRPPSLPNGTDLLDHYLAAGGRVLFFDGDQVDSSAWSECPWLPASPQQVTSAGERLYRIEPPGAKLAVWRSLGDAEDSLFDSVDVKRLRTITPHDKSVSIWLHTDVGAPLVVAKTIAPGTDWDEAGPDRVSTSGRVVQFAIPCDTAWSNLPLRPVFLPMMQELVMEMVGSDCPGDVLPGTAMVIVPVGRFDESDARVWEVSMPGKSTQTLSVAARAPLVFTDTQQVGAYRFEHVRVGDMENSSNDSGKDTVEASVPIHRAADPLVMPQVRVVEVPAEESTLRSVAPELLTECTERMGANLFSDADSLVAATTRDRFGVEVWRPLLWLLLVVMIVEVMWQQFGVTRSANRFSRSHAQATT